VIPTERRTRPPALKARVVTLLAEAVENGLTFGQTAEAVIRAVRAETLEEAARVAEGMAFDAIAARLRALEADAPPG
jgi:hypothetical protein